MSATPSVRRVNNAYVLVPPSPICLSSYRPLRTPVGSTKLKENTPLRPFQLVMSQQATSSPSLKRKLSERDPSSLVFDGVNPGPKRSKLSTGVTPLKKTQVQPLLPAANACPEFPSGFTYCHQCNKKRDLAATIHCTSVAKHQPTKDKNIKERLCTNRYCKSCLKNRYNEDFEVLRSGAPGPNGVASNFKCPRCKGICNCPRCRKSAGLDAIGPIKPRPKEPQAATKPNKSLKVEVVIQTRKPIFKSKPPNPLPLLKWTPISTGLTQAQADDRIFIREFALRFSAILDPALAKTYLEELEFISGRTRKQDGEEDSWISEACVKAMLVGLLGLLAKDYESDFSQLIKATVKDLKSAGVNLNKLWNALASLREDIGKKSLPGEPQLTFLDPSPPSAFNAATARPLRNTRQPKHLVNVVQTSQMIPVLLSLIHSVLETAIVREDLDQCVKDCKAFARDAKEATRIENERWEKEKGGVETTTKDQAQKSENQAKRMTHKDQILNIDNCLKITSRIFVPRFTTLGIDDEGRAYYALSPSVAERDAAFEYLEVASGEKPIKLKKKGRALSAEDQRELRDWSWFIAVWGKRPPFIPEEKTKKMYVDDADDEGGCGEDDSEEERWWAFWEPEEITKVADWISIKSGLKDKIKTSERETSSSSTSKPSTSSKEKSNISLTPRQEHLKRLVTELKDYATLLQWRVREDKCVLVSRTAGSAQTGQGPSNKGKDTVSTGTSSDNQ